METKELFEHYKDQYGTLKAALDAKEAGLVTEWSKDCIYNFVAFENERLGIPLGSKFKKWPAKIKNSYQYKYENGQLLFRAFHSEGSVTSELFYIYQPGRTIQVTMAGMERAQQLRALPSYGLTRACARQLIKNTPTPCRAKQLLTEK